MMQFPEFTNNVLIIFSFTLQVILFTSMMRNSALQLVHSDFKSLDGHEDWLCSLKYELF